MAGVGISSIGIGLSAHIVPGMWISHGLGRGRLGHIVTLMLRQRRYSAEQQDNRESGFHCPLSGPMTVTVCIIPPCMW